MKVFAAILLSVMLSGCVVYSDGYYGGPVVAYEPDVVVGPYYVGYYRPGFGYWTGYGWDVNFYYYGHSGYGHYYRGAPREEWHHYREGPHYYRGHDNDRMHTDHTHR